MSRRRLVRAAVTRHNPGAQASRDAATRATGIRRVTMPILHMSCRRAMLGLALAVGSRALPAQATSQPLPPELVTALFSDNNYASASSQYFAGVVPPGWPTELVPAPPISVSGGMRTGGRSFAVFVDSTTRHPRDTLRRQLETAGWTRPPNEPAQGFVAGFQADYGHYDFWCRDSVRATLG